MNDEPLNAELVQERLLLGPIPELCTRACAEHTHDSRRRGTGPAVREATEV